MDKKEEIYPLYRKIVYKILYKPLYNIVVLNIQRFGVFCAYILKIWQSIGSYSKREVLCLLRFQVSVFLLEKVYRR